jgi:hypothetical protein
MERLERKERIRHLQQVECLELLTQFEIVNGQVLGTPKGNRKEAFPMTEKRVELLNLLIEDTQEALNFFRNDYKLEKELKTLLAVKKRYETTFKKVKGMK